MSHVLHISIFAGGLCLGAAAGAVVAGKSSSKSAPIPPPSSSSAPSAPPSSSTGNAAIPFLSREILAYNATLPGPVNDLLEHAAYVSAYDRRLRHPAWTAEHLTAENVSRRADGTNGDRKYAVFKEDERIPETFRAKLADYFRSGYDRGHMVPAADAKRSQQAMDETFLLTNIAPQVGKGFNQDYWAYVEEFVRNLTKRYSDLYVFTIPLYLPQPDPARPGKWRVSYEVIGNPPNISVPTHFAKVVLAVDGPRNQPNGGNALPAPGAAGTSFLGARSSPAMALGAFVIPNAVIGDEVPLPTFSVPIDAIERAAGLNLFPQAIKAAAKPLCDCVPCKLVIRDWGNKKAPPAAVGGSGAGSPTSSAPSPQPAFGR